MRSQWYNIFADEKTSIDYSSAINKDIKSVKLFLTITLIASLIANIIVTVLFGVAQGFTYILICHILLIVVDIIFLILMSILNFRFKNSKFWMPTYLTIAIVIMIVSLVLPFIDSKHQSMTHIATGIYAAIDIIKIVSVIYAWKVAAKATPTKNNKLIGIISSILTIVFMLFYAGIVGFNGYFGQGIQMQDKEATLVFAYENDEYTVVGKYDDGNIINIPNEFNGKPVKYIDATLIENNSVNAIVINNSEVRFSNLGSLKTINSDIVINCSVENYNTVRKNLFLDLKTANSSNSSLLNTFIPSDVQSNQVWVDFNYVGLDFSNQAYIESFSIDDKYRNTSNEKYLDLMLEKNPSLKSKFEMSSDNFNDVLSKTNQTFLQDRYQNNNAKVLYKLEVVKKDAKSTNVDLYFDDVHELKLSVGNDSKARDTINLFTRYKSVSYVLDTQATNYFNKLPTRDGLSVAWSVNDYLVKNAEDFANTIDAYNSTINVEPTWTMNVPIIDSFKAYKSIDLVNEITFEKNKNKYGTSTYGDAVIFVCMAYSDPIATINLEYELYYDEFSTNNKTGMFEYEKITPSTETVHVRVRCNDSSVSELKSNYVNAGSIEFTINKKPLLFDWTLDGSSYSSPITFTGTSHLVGCSFDSNQLVYDDNFGIADFSTDGDLEGTDAKSYKVEVSLNTDFQKLYSIEPSTSKFEYVILQKEINHEWINLTFEYDGTAHTPSVILSAPEGNEIFSRSPVTATVTGSGIDAGTAYTASVSIDNPNYVLRDEEENPISGKNFTIEKRVVENPQFEYSETIYNAKAQYPIITSIDRYLGNIINQEELDYKFGEENDINNNIVKNIDVGTVKVTCEFDSNSNYKFADDKVIYYFEIKKFQLGVIWTKIQKVYNGQEQTADFITTGLEDDGVIGITTDTIKNVGSITVNVELNTNNTKSNNYELIDASKSFEVTKKEVAPIWTYTTVTYNGQQQCPIYSFENGAICDNDTVSISIDSKTDANTYSLTATLDNAIFDNANYSLDNNKTTVTFVIKQAKAKVVWDTISSYVYDGTSHTRSAVVTGINDVILESNVLGEGTYYQSTPYQTEVILLNAIDKQNYYLDYPKNVLTIAQKQLTINWSDEIFTYNGANQKPTATLVSSEFVGSDDVKVSVSGDNNINAGTYTVTATLNNLNYSVKPTKSYTINKKEVELTWGANSFTYNGAEQKPTATVNIASLCGSDVCAVNVTGGQTNVNSDCDYTAIASSLTNSNYKLPSTNITKTFSITQKEVEITWGANTFTYNGSEQKPIATVNSTSLCESDICAVNVTGGQTNVGSGYTATASSLTNSNYKLPSTNPTKTFSITKAQLTPDVVSVAAKQYDGTTDATNLVLGLKGAVNNEKPTATGSAVWTSVNAGTKTIDVLSIVLDDDWGDNYELSTTIISNQTVNNSIIQKQLTINWSDEPFTYNGANQKPTATLNPLEFVGSDDVKVSVSGDNNINAGTYTVTATLNNLNYSVKPTKSYTITQKEVELTWGANSFIFNGSEQKPTATATNLCGTDTCTVNVKGGQTNVGSNYTATASSLTNPNYKLPSTNITKTFSITQKEVEVTWGTNTFTYNGSEQKPVATVKSGSLCGSDSCSVNVTGEQTDVGSDYIATASSLTNSNYKLPSTNPTKTFSITKAQLTPNVVSVASKQYDGTTNTTNLVLGLNGVVNGEKPTATGSAAWTSVNAGTNTLNVSSISLDGNWGNNYELSATTISNQTVNSSITRKQLSESAIVVSSVASYIYEGSEITPSITVKDGSNGNLTLNNGTDYTVKYTNNVNAGTASILITLIGNYSGSKTVNFTINPKPVTPIVEAIADQTYTGAAITPSVTVKVGGKLLDSKYYTVKYSNNKNVGTASVEVALKDNYIGNATTEFNIVE